MANKTKEPGESKALTKGEIIKPGPARDKNGKWLKGQTGNPKGGPRKDAAIEKAARELVERGDYNWALETLRGIADNPKARGTDRIRAVELVMAYAYGRPRVRAEIAPAEGSGQVYVIKFGDQEIEI